MNTNSQPTTDDSQPVIHYSWRMKERKAHGSEAVSRDRNRERSEQNLKKRPVASLSVVEPAEGFLHRHSSFETVSRCDRSVEEVWFFAFFGALVCEVIDERL